MKTSLPIKTLITAPLLAAIGLSAFSGIASAHDNPVEPTALQQSTHTDAQSALQQAKKAGESKITTTVVLSLPKAEAQTAPAAKTVKKAAPVKKTAPAAKKTAPKASAKKTAPTFTKVEAQKAKKKSVKRGKHGSCKASMYGYRDGTAGGPTASGQRFNPKKLTAAHKTLKFGTKVKVTNKKNHKSVVVRINDRGPYAHGRCLDLSTAAMKKVGGFRSGVISAKWEVVR